MKRVKVITSYAGNARWFAEVGEAPLGYIPRQSAIPSPYAYSPTHIVYSWHGMPVIQVETRHRYYEVFQVPETMPVTQDEDTLLAQLFPR